MPRDLILQVDLNSPVTLAGVRAGLGKFLSWWGGELVAIFPAAWQRRHQAMFRTPTIVIEKNVWHLTNFNDGGRRFSFNPNLEANELRTGMTRIMDNAFGNSINVQLPKSDILFRRVSLPAAAASRLRSVVRLQLDRLSPFRGDDVCFDYRPMAAAEDGEITLEVAIIPKTILHGYEQKLREIGFVPRAFTVEESSLTFSPEGIPWTRQGQAQAFLALCGVAIWLAVFWLAPVARDSEIASLGAQIASLSAQARSAETEHLELGRYQLPSMAISQNRQPALDVLFEITKALPENAHLTDFSFKDGIILLRGISPASIDVRALLANSKTFRHATFSETSGQDHFESTIILHANPNGNPANAF